MSPLLRPLLRPRRALAALGLFAVLGGGLGGLLGAVAAAHGPEASSAGLPFTLALPRSGDHGAYSGGPEFTWLDDQVVHDRDGRPQWANMVRVGDALFALVPGGSDAFARVSPDKDGQDGAMGASVAGPGGTGSAYAAALQEFGGTLPCGLRSPLGGRTVAALGEEVAAPAACRQATGGTPRILRVRSASVGADGVRFLEAEEADAGGKVAATYLYREDVPYPLRIAPAHGPALELRSFARGTAAVRAAPQVVRDSPAPALELAAPNAVGGPSEAGVAHPYLLSAAFAGARDDADFHDLRDFLASHPGAYLAEARDRDLVGDGLDGAEMSWYLTVSDGRESLGLVASRQVREATQLGDPAGVLPDQVSYRYSAGEAQDATGVFPPPGHAPAAMPTVASQWRAWQAFAGAGYADRAPNEWGFSIRCGADCGDVVARYDAGYTHYARNYTRQDPLRHTVLPESPKDTEVRSLLGWSTASSLDHPVRYRESRSDWGPEGDAAAPAVPPASPHAARATQVAGLWAMPGGREVAAAGLGALLASLLYYLWPALKAGPAALFSRVRSEDLLENPTRAHIVQRIEAEPGIHHQALVRAVGRGQGAVEHHLKKLLDGGLVARVKGSRYTCYFPKGRLDYREMAAAPLLKSPVARSILDEVRRTPGIRSAELARALSVAPATVHYHVERLRSAGLVEGTLAHGALRLRPVTAT